MITLHSLRNSLTALPSSDRLPALFIGHGSPTNAIVQNDFTRSLYALGTSLPRPQVILVISAHWLTDGTFVSSTEKPRTIYDFYGFPPEMYTIEYLCAGAPVIAREISESISNATVSPDAQMGLDHGAWTILRHLYPLADIPVFQLSIDMQKPMEYHYALAKELRNYRSKGVLIIGSGNLVHNLRLVDWQNESGSSYEWAIAFDAFVKQHLLDGNHRQLIEYDKHTPHAQLAHPSNDHYIPLMYFIGAQDTSDELQFTYEGFQYGSVSMRCVKVG